MSLKLHPAGSGEQGVQTLPEHTNSLETPLMKYRNHPKASQPRRNYAVPQKWQRKTINTILISSVLVLISAATTIAQKQQPQASFDLSRCVLNLSSNDAGVSSFKEGQAKGGLLLIIHRCTMGLRSVDTKYVARMKAAAPEHLLWGAYHFLHDGEDPVFQADHFIKEIVDAHNQVGNDAPPKVLMAVDEEPYGTKTNVRMCSIHDLIRFVNRVKQVTGICPGIYVGQDFLINTLALDKLAKADADLLVRSWLWMARYTGFPEWPDNGIKTPWDIWTLWQYTGDNKGPGGPFHPKGVPALGLINAELNYFCGDRNKAKRFYDGLAWDYTLQSDTTYNDLMR
jgi:lysozyme